MVSKLKMTRTVRDFQNALIQLLENHKFNKLTVDQICEAAMLHRSSFYRYFHDKYDLLEQSLLTEINRIIDDQSDENTMIDLLVDYISNHRSLIRNLTDTESNGSLDSEMIKILVKMFMDQMRTSKHDTVLLRALRHSKNPELMASVFSGAIIGAAHWWRHEDFETPTKELIDTMKSNINLLAEAEMKQQDN